MKRCLLKAFTASLLSVVTMGLSPSSWSHGGEDKPTLKQQLAQSELTFSGQVWKVVYKLSSNGVPHTFVTYKVNQKYFGGIREGKTSKVTLRFLGGPMGDGSFLISSYIPHFNVGDTDILMVRDNNRSDCPLVGCMAGRVRMYGNGVYNAWGVAIRGFKEGRIEAKGKMKPELQNRTFPHAKFDELVKRKDVQALMKKKGLSEAELRKDFDQNAPKEVTFGVSDESHFSQTSHSIDRAYGSEPHSQQAEQMRQSSVAALSVKEFVATLKNDTRGLMAPQSLFTNAKASQAFTYAHPQPAVPPKVEEKVKAAAVTQSAFDRAEADALEAQGNDPVMSKPKPSN